MEKNGSERSGGNLAWTRRFLMSERLGSWLTEQIKKLRSDESKEVDERVFIKFGSQYSPIRLLGNIFKNGVHALIQSALFCENTDLRRVCLFFGL